VLATLHTNDAPSAITRLVDIGVEPYLITSSLLAVLAQRLVRRKCSTCSGSGRSADGTRCDPCWGSGYKGRLAVYEVLKMTDRLRVLANRNADAVELVAVARDEGFLDMRADAAEKIAAGLTDQAEVFRVLH
jgi:general secretion pathway protein E